ncbi:hypothetical protein BKA70DRAFT_1372185 [Coprinopsis sp. MPI-PUGE-AT-0042]|nr:hypothetical protein BKA70DRAFT_1372185 [Coprinopsis sp. MPI-PUGE-AT-0042]
MHASLVRRSLGGLVPPKIATPKLVSGGSGAGLGPLVDFYSNGFKGKFFTGQNASGAPLAWLIVGLFGVGYTIDYNKHHKNHAH